MHERVKFARATFLIDPLDHVEAERFGQLVSERAYCLEFPKGINVQEREGGGWPECLHSQVEHDRGIFADGVEHNRALELGGHLAQDVNSSASRAARWGDSGRVRDMGDIHYLALLRRTIIGSPLNAICPNDYMHNNILLVFYGLKRYEWRVICTCLIEGASA